MNLKNHHQVNIYETHGNQKSKTYNKHKKLKIKEHKHTTKENHRTTREETKRRNEQRRTTKSGKQVIKGIKYMPINNYFEMLQ